MGVFQFIATKSHKVGKVGAGLCNKKAKNRFIAYIDELSKVKLNGNACNHYSHDNPVNTTRRNNLLLYFQQMEKFNSRILMVGWKLVKGI